MSNLLGKEVEALFGSNFLKAPVLLKGKVASSNMTMTDYTLLLSDIPAELEEMLSKEHIYNGSYVKVDAKDIKYVISKYQGEEHRFIHNL